MSDKHQSIQDVFLNACRKQKEQVTVYLTNGVKLQGVITGFDNFAMVLRRSTQTQLVYKHGISTIVPFNPLDMYGKDETPQQTQADTDAEPTPPSFPPDEPFHIA